MSVTDALPASAGLIPTAPRMRSVTILGSTGSIGTSTVDVLRQAQAGGQDIRIEALCAGGRVEHLREQALALRPKLAVIADPAGYAALKEGLAGSGIEVAAGAEAVVEAAARPVDWTMAAIVGAAGLAPTLEALRNGGTVALANKECIVCAGALMLATARQYGATLLPVDSEHSAIFQSLTHPAAAERLCLTASGGPFRTKTLAEMKGMTPAQAIAHPNWSMGAKISVDSATMMNKGLELIEAAHLFDFPEDRIDVLVHPQSIIHSYVQYVDGSIIAQLGTPDMRTPIAFAFSWPERIAITSPRLDLVKIASLTFEAPDLGRFPALRLAREALRMGGLATAWLNGANEVAVAAFLGGRIGFLDIPAIAEDGLEAYSALRRNLAGEAVPEYSEVIEADRAARARAGQRICELAA